MTDTPKPTPAQRALAAFRSITLPQSITVAAIVAGTVYAFDQMADERLQLLLVTLSTLGVGGTLAFNRRAATPVAEPESAPPPPPAPTPRRVPRRDGSISDWMLWALAGLAFVTAWVQRLGWLS